MHPSTSTDGAVSQAYLSPSSRQPAPSLTQFKLSILQSYGRAPAILRKHSLHVKPRTART
ncbi:hypothetical protein FOMPIDRAFT_1060426 [Fomitopsis schrenkii]|uniref:Uncharacterized protein n=1 Tax=Fomitopsis schrenkii TaxID=2126942 RepID=S8E6G6_FOMSC|nr:hypothetical protein FOMPIDRAFT_1060426 [Fomitopsis schrenkii]